MDNTEILAERGGLKLVLNEDTNSGYLFSIYLGKYKICFAKNHKGMTNRKKCVEIWFNIDGYYVKETPELAKETASKMAIEWFNSLFENVQ